MSNTYVQEVEFTFKKAKRTLRYLWALTVRKACPKSLRGFDKKYPNLGQLKNDMLSIIKFVFVKTALVFVVIPSIAIGAVVYSFKKLKSLFTKKSQN